MVSCIVKSKRSIAIGKTLQRARVRQGMCQRELAEALHTTTSVISRIESGERDIKLSETILYAVGLKMTPNSLFLEIKGAFEDAGEL